MWGFIVALISGALMSIQGNAIYSMDAKSFAEHMKVLIENGASVVGGCCGTTPEFIREISRSLGR